MDLRTLVEPMFVRYGVNVAFAGHEHFYERIKPQQGVHYFTSGGAAKLSRGDLGSARRRERDLLEVGYDKDRHFMLIEIAGDELHFQAISRTGRTVDSGTIVRTEAQPRAGIPDAPRPSATATPRRRAAA
jgi:hypothetical protein